MALKRIVLRDFAIVRALELDLETGFGVLTGETGAGKSILVDALQLALGSRADATVVREGAMRAEVSAEFDPGDAVASWLHDGGFDSADTLLVRRTVDTQGKSRGWVNGSPATAGQLRELGERLLDIHGQHAWQSLTRPEAVHALLDAYAGIDTTTIARQWHDWRGAVKALEDARSAQESLQRERERLSWQIGEVAKLAPGVGEWQDINERHTRLSHAQALIDTAHAAVQALQDEERGANGGLGRAAALLEASQALEPEFNALAELLASSLAQAEDAAHSLQAYLRKTDPDPQQLAVLDARMAAWLSLARRYRRTPEDLPALLEGWQSELRALDAAADLQALEQREGAAAGAYGAEAARLARARATAAPKLSRAITEAMQGLGMQGGRFEVSLDTSVAAGPRGTEEAVFLVAGHAGSTPRPVGKVASGGELSRIALAIAVTTSALGTAQTLIFDEVDAGIGGAVAETVGRLMQRLGRDRQVLAVTHLTQVAAFADHHWVVSKKRSPDGGTESTVAPAAEEARLRELARMLGGGASAAALAHAQEMLEGARSRSTSGMPS